MAAVGGIQGKLSDQALAMDRAAPRRRPVDLDPVVARGQDVRLKERVDWRREAGDVPPQRVDNLGEGDGGEVNVHQNSCEA